MVGKFGMEFNLVGLVSLNKATKLKLSIICIQKQTVDSHYPNLLGPSVFR